MVIVGGILNAQVRLKHWLRFFTQVELHSMAATNLSFTARDGSKYLNALISEKQIEQLKTSCNNAVQISKHMRDSPMFTCRQQILLSGVYSSLSQWQMDYYDILKQSVEAAQDMDRHFTDISKNGPPPDPFAELSSQTETADLSSQLTIPTDLSSRLTIPADLSSQLDADCEPDIKKRKVILRQPDVKHGESECIDKAP